MDAICLYYTGNLYLDNFRDGDEPFTAMSHLLLLAQTESFLGVDVFLVFFNVGAIGFVIIAHISKRSVSRFIFAPNEIISTLLLKLRIFTCGVHRET